MGDDIYLKAMELINQHGPKSAEQNFMEASGGLDVMTPDQVPVTPQNLGRGIERAMRMSPNPAAREAVMARGFPPITQTDLGGGTVAVPPAAPAMRGETLSFLKGLQPEKPKTPTSLEQILAGEVQSKKMTLEEAYRQKRAEKPESVPDRVKQAQSFVVSVMSRINPKLDPFQALMIAQNPALLETMKASIPPDLQATYNGAIGIIKQHYAPSGDTPVADQPDVNDPLGYFKQDAPMGLRLERKTLTKQDAR